MAFQLNPDPWFGGANYGGIPFGVQGSGSKGQHDPMTGGTNGGGGGGTGTGFNFNPNPGTGGGGSQNAWSDLFGAGSGNNSGALPFFGSSASGTQDLSKIFGNLGPFILDFLKTGGYDQNTFNALVAQLQPQVDRGIATIGANTGASGTRFGSGYDLALGDYLGQVNANEQGLAANLYQQGVQNSLGILENIISPLTQFKSNQGGFGSSLLSSLIPSLIPLLGKIPGLGGIFGSGSNSGGGGGFSIGTPTGGSYGLPGGVGIPTFDPTQLPSPTDPLAFNSGNPFGNLQS